MDLKQLEKIFGRLSMLAVDVGLTYLYIVNAWKYWIADTMTGEGVFHIFLILPVVALWMLTLVFFIPDEEAE